MKKSAKFPYPSTSQTIGEQEMDNVYYTVDELLNMIDGLNRDACKRLHEENRELFEQAAGSTHNHQVWRGGYLDHVREIMNLAVKLYQCLGSLRELPFTLSDALLVLYIHDLEKPWMYAGSESTRFIPADKQDRNKFREKKLDAYGIVLNEGQMNAFRYVEGEIDGSYSSAERRMNELAAFCHMCDVASARLWHDRPHEQKEEWGQRRS